MIGANIRPSGQYLMEDFYYAGGLRAVMARLLDLLHAGALTVNGRTIGENVAGAESYNDAVISAREKPLGPEGGVAVLPGHLAVMPQDRRLGDAEVQVRRALLHHEPEQRIQMRPRLLHPLEGEDQVELGPGAHGVAIAPGRSG